MRALSLALIVLLASTAHAQTLFHDSFNGTALDKTTKWMVGTWDMGRAFFGHTPPLSGGLARFKLDTYHPSKPGTHFKGTEILSRQKFTRGTGLEFESRIRFNAMPDGIASGFYTFAPVPGLARTSDEIDFEFLSKWVNRPPAGGDRILMTQYNNWNATTSRYFDQIHHHDARVVVPGLDLNQFNTFKMRWLPNKTEWLVNNRLIHASSAALPNEPMPVKFNIWAAHSKWAEAYNQLLMPTSNPYANRSWSFDVDYVTVRRVGSFTAVPEPGLIAPLMLGFALLRRPIRRLAGRACRP